VDAISCRAAVPADWKMLAAFTSGGVDERVDTFIRERALELDENDHRVLIFSGDAGELVAVTTHQTNTLVLSGGVIIPGSELIVVAINAPFHDLRLSSGESLVGTVLNATFFDMDSRERGEFVMFLVHPDNEDGHRVAQHLDATADGTCDGDDVYILER
jgi:hypothetical protein